MTEKKPKENQPGNTKKQMFIKGGAPGPGRGHKKERQIELDGELLDMIEQVVRTGLGARDLKDRLKAAGIALKVQSMRKPDSGPVLEPFVAELLDLVPNLIGAYSNKTGIHITPLDLFKRMGEVCLNCDRLGTEEECEFVEVEKG